MVFNIPGVTFKDPSDYNYINPASQVEQINKAVEEYNEQGYGIKNILIYSVGATAGLITATPIGIIAGIAGSAFAIYTTFSNYAEKKAKAQKIQTLTDHLLENIKQASGFIINKEEVRQCDDFTAEELQLVKEYLPEKKPSVLDYKVSAYMQYTITAKPQISTFTSTPLQYKAEKIKDNAEELKEKLKPWRSLLKEATNPNSSMPKLSDFALHILGILSAQSTSNYHTCYSETQVFFPINEESKRYAIISSGKGRGDGVKLKDAEAFKQFFTSSVR